MRLFPNLELGSVHRRLAIRAVVLFLTLFLLDLALLGWLFIHDFDRRAIRERLTEAYDLGKILAENVSRELAPSGTLDYVRIVERQTAVGQMLDRYRATFQYIQSIDILTPDGRLILRQQFGGEGKGRVQMVGRAFGGAAPMSPDSPPPLEEGQKFRLVSPPVERVVQVPLAENAGTLLLGVTPNAFEESAARLRRSLTIRLFGGGAVSLVLIAIAFLYVLRLIQRTRKLEADTQRGEQLAYLGTLASGLAHEIRNPLNAMNINLQLLEEELEQEKVSEEMLTLLRGSRFEVLRLERLVKDFLAFARPKESVREDLSPDQLVEDLVKFLRPQFEETGVALDFTPQEGTPVVRVDSGQIRQALLNILRNAQDVSPRGTAVRVMVGPTAEGEALIEVNDHGPGIAAADLERVFEVFYSTKPAGSGLGLPIAKRAVESHGGRIEVQSRSGQGTTFRIVLPPAVATAPAETVSTGPAPGNGGGL